MTIEVDENLVGVWFIDLPKHDDWMAGVSELGPNKFKLTWRMRYADPLEPGANPWENIDRKSWHSGVFTGTRAEAVDKMMLMGHMLALAANTKLDYVLMNDARDVGKFLEEFSRRPWANMKTAQVGSKEWDELVKTFPELKDREK